MLTIRQAKALDATHISEIFNQSLGDGYTTRKDVLEYILGSDGCCLVAVSDGVIVGAVTGLVKNVDNIGEVFGEKNTQYILHSIPNDCHLIGVIKTMVVKPQWRSKGVGKALMIRVESSLSRQGAEFFSALCWDSGEKIISMDILDRYGYTQIGSCREFWLEDSIYQGFSCPICGNPCHCPAYVYAKIQ